MVEKSKADGRGYLLNDWDTWYYRGLYIKGLNKKYFYGILYVRNSYNLFMKEVCLWICRF